MYTKKNAAIANLIIGQLILSFKGQALVPIAGIGSEDAVAFCEWLNNQQTEPDNGGVRYRLPRMAELTAQPLSQPYMAGWCLDDNIFSTTGLDDENTRNIWLQLSRFLKTQLPPVATQYLTYDRANLLNRHITFPPEQGELYDNFTDNPLENIRDVLQPVLNLHYGHPTGRDMFIATNYNYAHFEDIVQAYRVASDRSLNLKERSYNDYTAYMEGKFELAGFTEVTAAVKNNDLSKALELIEQLASSKEVYEARWSFILKDYLRILQAGDTIQLRRAYRHYTAHMTLFAFIGYKASNSLPPYRNTIRWALHRAKQAQEAKVDYNQLLFYQQPGVPSIELQLLADLYWQMAVLIAREAGQLVAWEGIRLVCEQN